MNHVHCVCAIGWKKLFLFPRISVRKVDEENTDTSRKLKENRASVSTALFFKFKRYLNKHKNSDKYQNVFLFNFKKFVILDHYIRNVIYQF